MDHVFLRDILSDLGEKIEFQKFSRQNTARLWIVKVQEEILKILGMYQQNNSFTSCVHKISETF